jgi:hypothetical protein
MSENENDDRRHGIGHLEITGGKQLELAAMFDGVRRRFANVYKHAIAFHEASVQMENRRPSYTYTRQKLTIAPRRCIEAS